MRTSSVLACFMLVLTTSGCGSSSSSGTPGTGGNGGGSAGSTGSGGAGGSAGAGSGGSTGSGGSGSGGAGGLAACGSNTNPSSGDGCNNVDATGPCVMSTAGTGTPPAATGGTIVPGKYELTSMTLYANPDSGSNQGDDSRRQTLMIAAAAGGTFTIQVTQVSGTTVERQAGPVVASGTQVTFTPTCPPPGDGGDNGGTANYTATSTTFTLYDMNGSGDLRLSHFTKR